MRNFVILCEVNSTAEIHSLCFEYMFVCEGAFDADIWCRGKALSMNSIHEQSLQLLSIFVKIRTCSAERRR